MADEGIEALMGMTGMGQEAATMYLEMAGNSVEMAVALYFSAMEGGDNAGGDDGFQGSEALQGSEGGETVEEGENGDSAEIREIKRVVFAKPSAPIPEQWLVQSLAFGEGPELERGEVDAAWRGLCIHQPKNGPCGVLAAVEGLAAALLREEGRLRKGAAVTREDLYRVVAGILLRIARANLPARATAAAGEGSSGDDGGLVVRFARWERATGRREAVEQVEVSLGNDSDAEAAGVLGTGEDGDRLREAFWPYVDEYWGMGGALLLVYACVMTRTARRVAADMRSSGAEPLLIQGLFHSCTSGLLNLMLVGRAEDNMSAYTMQGDKRDLMPVPSKVGLLSVVEEELKILINDTLKLPSLPIYIFHGRDHFTLAFQPLADDEINATPSSSSSSATTERFELVHTNGLPPAGPRTCSIWITPLHGSVGEAPPSAAQGIGIEYKPTIGSMDSIIQACPADRSARPKLWQSWRYEVALVIDDPSNTSPEAPADHPRPRVLQLPEEHQEPALRGDTAVWRCRFCYETRYKTMCFGMNESPAALSPDECRCEHCGKTKREGGWTLWLDYEELCGWQGWVDKEYGPQINHLIRSKWPGCQIEFETPDNPPSI